MGIKLASTGFIICERCKTFAPRRGPKQKYCEPCSVARDLERKRNWASSNYAVTDAEVLRAKGRKRTGAAVARGAEINRDHVRGPDWISDVGMRWAVRVSVPFTYAASKNAIYRNVGRGHVVLRREHKAARDLLLDTLRAEVKRLTPNVVNNRVWLDVLVQKPDHKGDAVNVLGFVCDAVKVAIGVDDRWFSVRRLDWEICKNDPRLIVGVSQDVSENCIACSHCGRVLPLPMFYSAPNALHGVNRACKECSRTRRKVGPDPEIFG